MPSWLVTLVPAGVLAWLGIQELQVIYDRKGRVIQQKEFWRAFSNLALIVAALIGVGILAVFPVR